MENAGRLPPKRRLAMLARTIRGVVATPRPQTFPALTAAHLPAMRGRLEVIRDANGIPHIYAEEEPDLFAALGFLQAADRFILLDIVRHLGAGRLCELVGNFSTPSGSEVFSGKGIRDVDGFVRPLDFEAQSARDFERLDGRARHCLEAFAAGINAALKAMRGVYPPEYLLLGGVRPWRPSDALLAAQACAFCIALSPLDIELTFDAVRGRIGDAAARRLYPEAPWENVPTTYAVVDGPEPQLPLHFAAGGSNNWAVGAARSVSGSPLVANDPHVPLLPLPTFWYHAHLDCRRYRVQGGMMLGCPIFGYGHNGFLAWGVTTAYRDGWDVYRIHRLPGDPTRYRTVDGSAAITGHRERHRARLGRPIELQWEQCDHGIVYPGWTHHDGTDLAVRHVPSDLASYFEGYLALAESTTVEEHQRALARINDGPFDFNHVYAHRDGHFAWEPFGRLPRRVGDGLFVRDAHDPAAQWDGFLPFSRNPKMINPARGLVASANSIGDPQTFAVATTRVHVEPAHRQRRIESFLADNGPHSYETFAALQRDVGTDYGPPMRDALLQLCAGFAERTDAVGHAYRALATWDGTFGCDSAAAPLLSFTQHELARRIFEALLGRDVGRRYLNTRRAVSRLQRLLLDSADPLRPDVEHSSGMSWHDLAGAAFESAVKRVVAACGPDPARWRWGTIQRLRLGTLLGELPLVGGYFRAIEAPFPGDVYTVSPSVALPVGDTLRVIVGASSRFICDLARPDEAWFAHSSGPSADVGSTFFGNLSAAWYRFEYFRSALWKPAEVPQPVERLVIEPAA